MNTSGFFSPLNFYTNSIVDSPNIPTAKNVNREYVLIYLACNDSPEIIKSVMANKLFHAECRRCMCNLKAMESEPTWIRAPTRNAPKPPPVNNVSWIVLFFPGYSVVVDFSLFVCGRFFWMLSLWEVASGVWFSRQTSTIINFTQLFRNAERESYAQRLCDSPVRLEWY